MTGLMVAPPLPSDPSGATYAKEREDTLASLARRAAKVNGQIDTCPCCRIHSGGFNFISLCSRLVCLFSF